MPNGVKAREAQKEKEASQEQLQQKLEKKRELVFFAKGKEKVNFLPFINEKLNASGFNGIDAASLNLKGNEKIDSINIKKKNGSYSLEINWERPPMKYNRISLEKAPKIEMEIPTVTAAASTTEMSPESQEKMRLESARMKRIQEEIDRINGVVRPTVKAQEPEPVETRVTFEISTAEPSTTYVSGHSAEEIYYNNLSPEEKKEFDKKVRENIVKEWKGYAKNAGLAIVESVLPVVDAAIKSYNVLITEKDPEVRDYYIKQTLVAGIGWQSLDFIPVGGLVGGTAARKALKAAGNKMKKEIIDYGKSQGLKNDVVEDMAKKVDNLANDPELLSSIERVMEKAKKESFPLEVLEKPPKAEVKIAKAERKPIRVDRREDIENALKKNPKTEFYYDDPLNTMDRFFRREEWQDTFVRFKIMTKEDIEAINRTKTKEELISKVKEIFAKNKGPGSSETDLAYMFRLTGKDGDFNRNLEHALFSIKPEAAEKVAKARAVKTDTKKQLELARQSPLLETKEGEVWKALNQQMEVSEKVLERIVGKGAIPNEYMLTTEGIEVVIQAYDKGKTWLLNHLSMEMGDTGLRAYTEALSETIAEFEKRFLKGNTVMTGGDEIVSVFVGENAASAEMFEELFRFNLRNRIAASSEFSELSNSLKDAINKSSVHSTKATLKLDDKTRKLYFEYKGVEGTENLTLGQLVTRAETDKVFLELSEKSRKALDEMRNLKMQENTMKYINIKTGEDKLAKSTISYRINFNEKIRAAFEEVAEKEGKALTAARQNKVGPSLVNLIGHTATDALDEIYYNGLREFFEKKGMEMPFKKNGAMTFSSLTNVSDEVMKEAGEYANRYFTKNANRYGADVCNSFIGASKEEVAIKIVKDLSNTSKITVEEIGRVDRGVALLQLDKNNLKYVINENASADVVEKLGKELPLWVRGTPELIDYLNISWEKLSKMINFENLAVENAEKYLGNVPYVR